mgnify:CR=1 FL=1
MIVTPGVEVVSFPLTPEAASTIRLFAFTSPLSTKGFNARIAAVAAAGEPLRPRRVRRRPERVPAGPHVHEDRIVVVPDGQVIVMDEAVAFCLRGLLEA